MTAHAYRKRSFNFKIVPLFIASLGALFTLYLAVSFFIHKTTITNTVNVQSQEKTKQAAQQITDLSQEMSAVVSELVAQLQSGAIVASTSAQHLTTKNVALSGIGIAFSNPWFAPYYVERNGSQELVQVPATLQESSWYQHAIETGTSSFATSADPVSQEKSLIFVAPWKSSTNSGVVFATVSMAHIKHILNTLYLGQSGYWFVANEQGELVIHPLTLLSKKTVEQISRELNDASLWSTFKESTNKELGFHEYNNEVTGNPSWLFLKSVPNTGLIIGGVFDKSELPIQPEFYRHYFLLLLTSFAVTLLGLLFMVVDVSYTQTNYVFWILSSVSTLVLLMALIGSWVVTSYYPSYPETNIVVTSKGQLYQLLEEFKKPLNGSQQTQSEETGKNLTSLLQYRYKKGNYVPTGFLINDIQIVSQDQIEFVGYIWQRYFEGIHDNLSRGFMFPQIAGKPEITQISKTKIEKAEIIIWQVQARLNQNFDYTLYPFDVKDIELQIRHKDFEKSVILVPDIDAYDIINPTALPGINPDTHIPNWRLRKSYFSYEKQNYTTNFGLYAYGPFGIYQKVEQVNMPELHFDVIAQRNLLDTIMTDLLTLAVIAVILFALLLSYFSNGSFEMLLGTAATAFFSTVFAQIQFRTKMPSNEFIYFEIFYFTLYVTILMILIMSLIHLFKINIPIIQYRNNLITKLLYWPFILSIILIVTLFYLY